MNTFKPLAPYGSFKYLPLTTKVGAAPKLPAKSGQ